jgi:hypothetical protein
MRPHLLRVALIVIFLSGAVCRAQDSTPPRQVVKPDIVLGHGAHADGSSRGTVLAILQAQNYHVVSVPNPTTSLADDVTVTERVLIH